ncbi:membrane protein insertion efficiency factor YidD, partial [Streptomyces sp. DH18]
MARRAILGYQEYLSPLKMGSTCRFDPTCSNYA